MGASFYEHNRRRDQCRDCGATPISASTADGGATAETAVGAPPSASTTNGGADAETVGTPPSAKCGEREKEMRESGEKGTSNWGGVVKKSLPKEPCRSVCVVCLRRRRIHIWDTWRMNIWCVYVVYV